ncbi:Mitochondrial translocator assembly and maintenance protein 41 [Intoshia linei]|uniref:Phosphatidate cytidylyltransferase, mitochondrial n=1 Tax=Intoshia linei TaxID=1819745 RepID=A0A177BCF9_9BILA|nr:Mitochondrial translocator assembly and maintenance protein 41 [Intoshia linei]
MNIFRREIVKIFPKTNTNLICGYGSGFFQQNSKVEEKMIDMMICVNDSLSWHKENIQQNHQHYSGLMKLFGPKLISTLQRCGEKVYFNTGSQFLGHSIKYGVIDSNSFKDDLLLWKNMYISGRFHKPIEMLYSTPQIKNLDLHQFNVDKPVNIQKCDLSFAIHRNRFMALSTAILMLSIEKENTFLFRNIFQRISNLSYGGDVRTYFAEDTKKVEKIINGSYSKFVDIYQPYFKILSDTLPNDIFIDEDKHTITIIKSSKLNEYLKYTIEPILQELYTKKSFIPQFNKILQKRVFWSSISQAIKCSITVKPSISIRYIIRKMNKFMNSQ